MSRLKQSVIAALGVTFGIGTFIILVSFMTGLNNLLDGLILNRTPHVHVYNEVRPSEKQPLDFDIRFNESLNIIHSIKPKFTQERIHNALPLISHFKADQRVKGVTPLVRAQAFYAAGSLQMNGLLNGIDIIEEVRLFKIDDYIFEGEANALKRTANGILLGIGIAKKLSLHVGDNVQIISSRGDNFQLKIVGFYQSGLAEIDNVQSYVNLKTAQQILGEGDNYVTDINIKLHELDEAVAMASEIESNFDLTAIDINEANAQFETGTSIRNIITYAVSITLLVVAGFGIYNILNMLIYEKMNDIAILKATGFSGTDVKYIFISQALIIGMIGGILGLVFGYGISVIIDNTPFVTEALPTIKTFPVNWNPIYYFIGIGFALLSTFLAGYLPARRAEHIDPIEIIRGQ
ncbi:MAG: FtsX-like permease family protein [Fulvivirga sp.]